MLAKKPVDKGANLFYSSLSVMLHQKHPLFILSHQIDWSVFEEAFSVLYCLDNWRPAKPIRLMVGLLILKHLRNISDESVVEQWAENAYYQYFCGQQDFTPTAPCEASDLLTGYCDKKEVTKTRFIPFMNLKYNAFQKGKSIRNMSLATRYPLFIPKIQV